MPTVTLLARVRPLEEPSKSFLEVMLLQPALPGQHPVSIHRAGLTPFCQVSGTDLRLHSTKSSELWAKTFPCPH